MKLFFDRPAPEYHPATGLMLVPGEFEYPDDKVEGLKVAGLHEPAATELPAPKPAAVQAEKEQE